MPLVDTRTIGAKFLQRRQALHISLEKVASLAKMHKATLSNIERGVRIPGIDAYQRIDTALSFLEFQHQQSTTTAA